MEMLLSLFAYVLPVQAETKQTNLGAFPLTPLLCSNFTHIYYAWGQFDPSNLNLQKIIIIILFYPSLCVRYLRFVCCLPKQPLKLKQYPHPLPLYIQNTCYATMEKYADPHKISLIDLKLERDILLVFLWLHIISKYILLLSITFGIKNYFFYQEK